MKLSTTEKNNDFFKNEKKYLVCNAYDKRTLVCQKKNLNEKRGLLCRLSVITLINEKNVYYK